MNYLIITRSVIIALITAIVILGFISILSIWDVIENEDILFKSLTTSLVLVIVGAVTLTSLKFLEDRENNSNRKR